MSFIYIYRSKELNFIEVTLYAVNIYLVLFLFFFFPFFGFGAGLEGFGGAINAFGIQSSGFGGAISFL